MEILFLHKPSIRLVSLKPQHKIKRDSFRYDYPEIIQTSHPQKPMATIQLKIKTKWLLQITNSNIIKTLKIHIEKIKILY